MDRTDVAALQQDRIPDALGDGPIGERWNKLEEQAGGEAAQLLQLVCRLDPPERISELRDLETGQGERGAGFLGMLPDQIPDDLGVPSDLEASLDVATRLARIRAANLEALAETMPDYPLSFLDSTSRVPNADPVPAGWRLDVDVDGIRAALDFLDAGKADEAAATAIARMPAFAEMMRHRRDLGYVPEPIIDEAGFAWCLVHAASLDPIDALWKWIHPQNLFDLSDLYAHRDRYRDLTARLAGDGKLAAYVLGSIARYAPNGAAFEDRFSFAVGWAINGWATRTTGGMNIEHTKNNLDRLLPLLVHETFHRLQTSVALGNPTIDEPGFDRITSYPFDAAGDRALYSALCYVMLEGSATYVADPKPMPGWEEDAEVAIELLERIRALGSEEEEAFNELLSEALRSNGPFYGFGALLSCAHVVEGGPTSLGIALQHGAPLFIDRGLALLGDAGPAMPEPLAAHVAHLRDAIASWE